MIDIDRSRLHPMIAAPMLGVCTDPACATIVFGCGTCVDHDPLPVHPADSGLEEADGWTNISRAAIQLQQTIEP
jgi:hypothetical protein